MIRLFQLTVAKICFSFVMARLNVLRILAERG
jgi:hypothetical protein